MHIRRSLSIFLIILLLAAPLAAFAYSGPVAQTVSRAITPRFSAYYNGNLSSTLGNFAASDYNVWQGEKAYADTEEINGTGDISGVLHMKTASRASGGSYRLKMNSPTSTAAAAKYMSSGTVTLELCARFNDLVELKDGLLEGKQSPVNQSDFHPGTSYTSATSPQAENFGNVGYNLEFCLPDSNVSDPKNCKAVVLSFARYHDPNGAGAGKSTNAVVMLASGSRFDLDREKADVSYALLNLDFSAYHRYTLNYDKARTENKVLFYIDGVLAAEFGDLMHRAATDGAAKAYTSAFCYHTLVYRSASCKSDGAHFNDICIDSVELYDSILTPVGEKPAAFRASREERERWAQAVAAAEKIDRTLFSASELADLDAALKDRPCPAPEDASGEDLTKWADEAESAVEILNGLNPVERAALWAVYDEAASLDLSAYTTFSAARLQDALEQVPYPLLPQTTAQDILFWKTQIASALSLLTERPDAEEVPIVQTASKGVEGVGDEAIASLRSSWESYSSQSTASGSASCVYAFPEAALCGIGITWYQGEGTLTDPTLNQGRSYTFTAEISDNGGKSWTGVYSGSSAGKLTEEYYPVQGTGHLLRITCTGADAGTGHIPYFAMRSLCLYGTKTGASAGNAADATRQIKIACIGDSITYGSGSADDRENPGARNTKKNYPGRLQEYLGDGYEVTNYGIAGATVMRGSGAADATPQGYLASATAKNLLNSDADIVLIMLGTNDSKPHVWEEDNNGAEDYEAMLTELILAVKNMESAPRVYVLLSPPTLPEGVNGGCYEIRNSVLASEIIPLQRKVANELGCTVINVRALFPDPDTAPDSEAAMEELATLLVDGVHPNSAGYALLSRRVADTVLRDAGLIGDLDKSGTSDIADLTLLAKSLAGWNVDVNPVWGDLDRDGDCTIADLTLLAKSLAGWDVSFR